jgi:hypothetical protein
MESDITANTAKTGITPTQASNITTNNAKVTANTTNVTAAGAVMDSELTSEADVKALDQSVVSGASPVLAIANMTLDDTELVVADTTNLQTFANLTDKAVTRARGTGVATSYVSTVAVGGTTFAQPAIEGEITSDEGYFEISYAGATGITVADLNATSTWVYIDKNSALQQQTTTPTREDRTRKAFTMRIGVNTSTNQIIDFEYDNNPIGHYANSMRDLYEFLLVQGVPFKKDQLVTGRTDNLGFDVSAGELLEFGGTGDINNPNIKSFDAVANTAYNWMSRTALVSSQTNLLKIWDNAGTFTVLGSTTCVAHRLYRFSSGNFAIQAGQGNYANMTLAKAGAKLEEYVLNPALKDATFFGWWLIEETATATSGTVDAEFVEYTLGVQGGSSSGLSGALLVGNNLSDLLDTSVARSNIGLATTANQTDSADKRFMTDAQETAVDTIGAKVPYTTGAGAPATTPTSVPSIYFDTTADDYYFATGTTDSDDWSISLSGGSLTKGSVLVSNGTNLVELGVGSDGQIIEARASETLGVRWIANSGGSGSVTSGAGAPGSAPSSNEDIYHDTTNKRVYHAFGTSSVSDWRYQETIAA